MTILHSSILVRDEREREHAVAMRRDPACRGVITVAASPHQKWGPVTWNIWRCDGCGHEAASPGPDHPLYGDDRRGDARPSGGRI